jgi:chaperonin GroEL
MKNEQENIFYGKETRARLIRGANKMAAAVAITMGPRGKLVVIDDGKSIPHLTKDGVTVANAISLIDQVENAGAVILREAARKTAQEAGDGTTTTSVLAAAIMRSGDKFLNANEKNNKSREFFEGLDAALEFALKHLEQQKKEIYSREQIKHVATISANGDLKLGNMLADAIDKLGNRAIILVEEGKTFETTMEFVDGTEIDRGFISPHFINDASSSKCRFEKPLVVILNKKIATFKEILPLLEFASKPTAISKNSPLLLFAQDYDSEVVKGLTQNNSRGAISVCACKIPEFGQGMYEAALDLAAIFGCEVISDGDFSESGVLNFVKEKHAGTAELTEVLRNKTVIIKPNMNVEKVNERIAGIDQELQQGSDGEDRKNMLQRRLQRLASGVAILRVGAATEIELKEKLDRVDDAVNATRVAALYGVLIGGGEALRRVSTNLRFTAKLITKKERQDAYFCLADALESPFRAILANSGYNEREVEKQLISSKTTGESCGFNALTGKISNLFEDGVIDPYYVTKSSLTNAMSVAKKILEVGCVVTTGYSSHNEIEV